MTILFFLTLSIVLSQSFIPDKREGYVYKDGFSSNGLYPHMTEVYHLGVPFKEGEAWYVYQYGLYINKYLLAKIRCNDENCQQLGSPVGSYYGFYTLPKFNSEIIVIPSNGACPSECQEQTTVDISKVVYFQTVVTDYCFEINSNSHVKLKLSEDGKKIILKQFNSHEKCLNNEDAFKEDEYEIGCCNPSDFIDDSYYYYGFTDDDFIVNQKGSVIYNYDNDPLTTKSITLGHCFKYADNVYAKILKQKHSYYLYKYNGNECILASETIDVSNSVFTELNLDDFGAAVMSTDKQCSNKDKDEVPMVNYFKINQCIKDTENYVMATISTDNNENKLTRTSYTNDQCTEGSTTLLTYQCDTCIDGLYVDCDISDGVGVEFIDCDASRFERRNPDNKMECICMENYRDDGYGCLYICDPDAFLTQNYQNTGCQCKVFYEDNGDGCKYICDPEGFLTQNDDNTGCKCMDNYYRVDEFSECQEEASCDPNKFEKWTYDHTQCECMDNYKNDGQGCKYICKKEDHLQTNAANTGCDCEKGYKKENNKCVEDNGTVMTMILSILTLLFFIL